MPETIKVGVITQPQGAHLDAYLPALARTAEAEAVAVADPSEHVFPLARKALGQKLAATYADAADMLRQFQPHMVLISMEAVLAPPMIEASLDAGCHVLTEKPACAQVEDFERLAVKASVSTVTSCSRWPIGSIRAFVKHGGFLWKESSVRSTAWRF